jgi:CRP/FNR family transcriptional regulator, cyclic AMP receptor protein
MSDEFKLAYLKSHPLFNSLPENRCKDVANCARMKNVFRGETFGNGETGFSKIFLLIKGKIKITELDQQGNELIKDFLTAYDVFGDLSLEGKPNLDENAEALTANTVICSFYVTDFKRILEENPTVALRYAKSMNEKLKKLERRHSDLVFQDAKTRLIRFIKNWASTDGSIVGNKIVLNNYLTHSDIAGVIATSRQSVNVLLNELRDAGMLFYNRKKIELNNPMTWN